MLLKLAALSLLLTPILSIKNITNEKNQHICNRWGYWGHDCDTVCSEGCLPVTDSYADIIKKYPKITQEDYNQIHNTRACAQDSGYCLQYDDTRNCDLGWHNNFEYHRCDVPMCFGENGCDHGGVCVEPDYCMCGNVGAQIVGLWGEYTYPGPERKVDVVFEGVQCISLRQSGIKGAFLALVVMTVCISFCAIVAEKGSSILNKKGQ